jgi:hypothetical protein
MEQHAGAKSLYSTLKLHHLTLTNQHTNITLENFLSSSWPHRVFTRLVLCSLQTHVQVNESREFKSIAKCVNKSTHCNFVQLVFREDGSTTVQTYDWTDYLAPRMKIRGIKMYYHFSFAWGVLCHRTK